MSTTRILTAARVNGVPQPFLGTDGQPMRGVRVSIKLIPSSVVDVDGGIIISRAETTTDQNGVPRDVALYQCDRALMPVGVPAPYYQAHIHHPLAIDFNGSVPSSADPLDWLQFRQYAETLTAAEISALATYATATDARLVALEAGAGSAEYPHTQSVAATTWTINHNLGYRPSVAVTDAGGNERTGSVLHVSDNITTISFSTALAGSARLI